MSGDADLANQAGIHTLPQLFDCARIVREVGVKRATAERIMRLCDRKVVLGRRVYVYEADVLDVLRQHEIWDAA